MSVLHCEKGQYITFNIEQLYNYLNQKSFYNK